MGSGIAKTVRTLYPNVFDDYEDWCNKLGNKLLGHNQIVRIADGTYIANVFSQDDFGGNAVHTDYMAFENCVKELSEISTRNKYTIGFPYLIGCDRGGGDWNIVYGILKKYFDNEHCNCEIIRLR
jgi:hypothetical protein